MRILITGGAACGKSAYAEQRALELKAPHAYVATMRVYGDEDLSRVRRHRDMRAGKGFETFELAHLEDCLQLSDSLPEHATVLLEDLGNLVSNALFDENGAMYDESKAHEEINAALDMLADSSANLIVVGNEVGAGAECQTPELQSYISLLGAIACEYAASCDEVIEVVCGVPRVLKR